MKIVFFPLNTTPLIVSRICFFHSCVYNGGSESCTTNTRRSFSSASYFTRETPSLAEIFAIIVDNSVSYCTTSASSSTVLESQNS